MLLLVAVVALEIVLDSPISCTLTGIKKENKKDRGEVGRKTEGERNRKKKREGEKERQKWNFC